ncbi:hypothetical protein HYQ46_002109 [Verticillium longisporum]|nr:hypothetical protein HYQ46_002109 [Verticillium longisporum]
MHPADRVPEVYSSRRATILLRTRFSFSSLVRRAVLYLRDSAFHSSLVFLEPSTFFQGSSRMAAWASVYMSSTPSASTSSSTYCWNWDL